MIVLFSVEPAKQASSVLSAKHNVILPEQGARGGGGGVSKLHQYCYFVDVPYQIFGVFAAFLTLARSRAPTEALNSVHIPLLPSLPECFVCVCYRSQVRWVHR